MCQRATPACDPLLITGVLFGKLGARPEPIAFYREMEQAPEFIAPRKWSDCRAADFDALFLAGGHAPGMKQYLGSDVVQQLVREFFATPKPIGAICHGVLVAARANVLSGVKTTCLPKYMERSAYLATFWRRADDFVRGPRELSKRGTREDDTHAFVVEDGRYVSARWPGDAYLIAKKLIDRLNQSVARAS